MANSKKTRYIVVGQRQTRENFFSYINTETKDILNIWQTTRPFQLNEDAGEPIPPMLFDNRSVAVEFKNRLNAEEKSNYDSWYSDMRTKFKVINETVFNTVYIKYDKNQRVTLS